MRLDAILFRVLGTYALVGVLLFGVRWSPPAPIRVVVATPQIVSAPVVNVAAVAEEPDGWFDSVVRRLAGWLEDVPRLLANLPAPPPRERKPEPKPVVSIAVDDPAETLPPLPKLLTPGRRAALRAVLMGDLYLLYFGKPPGDYGEDLRDEPPLVFGIQLRRARARGGVPQREFRFESVGDSVDPGLARYVRDFNLQMLHARRWGLARTRAQDGLWSAAARLDKDADAVLFTLLDDPTDGVATACDPETGACELDLGRSDGVVFGMRFVLWAQYRPLRRALALVEVHKVEKTRCRVRVIRKLSDAWPAAAAIRASNPFFHRGRKVAGIIVGTKDASIPGRFKGLPYASAYDSIQFPYFCVVGDVRSDPEIVLPGRRGVARRVRAGDVLRDANNESLIDRAKSAGAIFVPERLVPYLQPLR